MIKITRPAYPPAVLARGAQPVADMHQAVAAAPGYAGTSDAPFAFDSKIYGDRAVKDALLDAQHKKCAYCEGHFLAFGWGDVEHYRPKGYYQQRKGGRKYRPGYYWLAYDWSNLLASCAKCNQLRKKNLFPLRNEANRATTPHQLAQEDPLIIDPAGPGDPRTHIGFHQNVAMPLTEEGAATIDAVALDRSELNGLRLAHLRRVIALKNAILLASRHNDEEALEILADAEAQLEELQAPSAPFSAMTRCFLGT